MHELNNIEQLINVSYRSHLLDMQNGRIEAMNAGQYPMPAPAGMSKEDGYLYPAPAAKYIQHAFAMRAEGHSHAWIARYLTQIEVPPARGKMGRWSAAMVRNMLANPIYKGHAILRWGGEIVMTRDMPNARIVGDALFDAAND